MIYDGTTKSGKKVIREHSSNPLTNRLIRAIMREYKKFGISSTIVYKVNEHVYDKEKNIYTTMETGDWERDINISRILIIRYLKEHEDKFIMEFLL